MSYSMKMRERVIDGSNGQELQISQQQYGFMPGESTKDVVFALRVNIDL